ncbi:MULTISPECIES: hypothetical protein [Eikenella]|uniref:Uncharacterized protein n=1 Tax=Eikenella longinqua TaxID=1795827 RepID=A0A1A9RUU8_9NEIS|nr:MULTISPECIES: hypothetical protein [Eikenella]OAM26083.1 hypothetical protein A7P95_10245 [Eikenella longinqua]
MDISVLLQQKIRNADYIRLIQSNSARFSRAETGLLAEILLGYEFDVVQQQALAQAVLQQSRFDPDAFHQEFDDEDVTGICPHCINPPMPPLRDYLVWRQTLAKQAT